jgi:hypothetical protein
MPFVIELLLRNPVAVVIDALVLGEMHMLFLSCFIWSCFDDVWNNFET